MGSGVETLFGALATALPEENALTLTHQLRMNPAIGERADSTPIDLDGPRPTQDG